VKATLAFTILLALLFVPYWASVRAAPSSGTVAYATTWNANELAFQVIQSLGMRLSKMTGYAVESRVAARAILLVLLLGVALGLGLGARGRGVERLALGASTVVLLMLLAGPTVYPWYFLPAVAVSPFLKRPAFLFWTPLLILTYLSRSVPHPFWLLVMIHLPAWLIVILQLRELFRRGANDDAQ